MTQILNEGSGVKFTSLSVFLSSAIQIGITIFLANVTSPEIIGSIAICVLIYSVIDSFSEVGFSGGLIQRKKLSNRLLRSVFLYSSILASILSLLSIFVVNCFFPEYNELSLIFLLLVVNQIGGISKTLLKKNFVFSKIAKCEILNHSLFCVLYISTSLYNEKYVINYILLRLLSSFVYNIVLYYSGRRYFSIQIATGSSFKLAYWFIRFGIYQFFSMSLNMLGRNIDQLLILKFAGKETLGIYKVICDLLIIPTSKVNSIFNNVYHPILAKLSYDRKEYKQKLVSLIELTSFITLPILFGVFLLKDILPNTILSNSWEGESAIFLALLIVAIIRALGNPLGVMILSLGFVKLGFYWNILSLIVQVSICSILGYFFNSDGVIGGLVISSLILHFLTYIILIRRTIGLNIGEYFSIPITTIFCCTAMLLIGFSSQSLFDNRGWAMFVSQIALGVLVYVCSSLLINKVTVKKIIRNFK